MSAHHDETDRTRASIARFDPSVPVEAAATPPSSWYTSPELYQLERERVFRRNWFPACRVDQVAAPGSYVAGELSGEPWLVVRGADGELRAFRNVCRHHAAVLLEGEGEVTRIVCPYHAWSYELDGRLRSSPRMERATGFDRAELGLRAVALEVHGPYVFLHLGDDPRPAGLEFLAERLARLDELRFVARRSWNLRCNWKVFVDNYLDGGYHVSHLHPELASHLAMSTYGNELFDRHTIQTCRGDEGERLGEAAQYVWIHPALMLNRYGPVLDVNLAIPRGPDRTEVVFDYFFEPEAADDPAFVARCLEESALVQEQDVSISESVQRGLESSAYDTGRYAPGVEDGAHLFHRLLHAELMGDEA